MVIGEELLENGEEEMVIELLLIGTGWKNINRFNVWKLPEHNYFCPELFNKGFGS